MSNVAQFPVPAGGAYPDAPPAPPTFERDLRLSLLASQIAEQLHEAAALQAGIKVQPFSSLPARTQAHFRELAEQAIQRMNPLAYRRAVNVAQRHFQAGRLSFEEAVNLALAQLSAQGITQ
jgi:hypothetical protein